MFSIFTKLFKKEECAICLETLKRGRDYCSTTCGHKYHTSCLLRCNGRCPLCRNELVPEEHNEIDDSLSEYMAALSYRESVQFAFDEIDRFYQMPDTPEHYGIKDVIDDVRTAYLNRNKQEIDRIGNEYYRKKIDPMHPEGVVEWDLYRAFVRLSDDLGNVAV